MCGFGFSPRHPAGAAISGEIFDNLKSIIIMQRGEADALRCELLNEPSLRVHLLVNDEMGQTSQPENAGNFNHIFASSFDWQERDSTRHFNGFVKKSRLFDYAISAGFLSTKYLPFSFWEKLI